MMRLPDTYSLYFNKKENLIIYKSLDGRTLDDLWKRMPLLLWERREGLYMSLQHEKSWSAAETRRRDETRRDDERWTDLWPLDL